MTIRVVQLGRHVTSNPADCGCYMRDGMVFRCKAHSELTDAQIAAMYRSVFKLPEPEVEYAMTRADALQLCRDALTVAASTAGELTRVVQTLAHQALAALDATEPHVEP